MKEFVTWKGTEPTPTQLHCHLQPHRPNPGTVPPQWPRARTNPRQQDNLAPTRETPRAPTLGMRRNQEGYPSEATTAPMALNQPNTPLGAIGHQTWAFQDVAPLPTQTTRHQSGQPPAGPPHGVVRAPQAIPTSTPSSTLTQCRPRPGTPQRHHEGAPTVGAVRENPGQPVEASPPSAMIHQTSQDHRLHADPSRYSQPLGPYCPPRHSQIPLPLRATQPQTLF
ncbi:hypothetical protein CRENBAI_009344 [Crenichthys baileyi]|uniref:Uncharacterized protein n=1 Tax=Crenichthys baileyi TaxID=28760 RepID=A0AAV9SCN8_9TELE